MINEPKFYLVRPSEYSTAIVCKVTIDSKRLAVGTGERIISALWDKTAKRPTKSKTLISKYNRKEANISANLINLANRLDTFKKSVEDYINSVVEKSEKVSAAGLKLFVKNGFTSRTISKLDETTTLNGFIGKYVDDIEAGRITYNKKQGGKTVNVKYQASTVKSKRSWQRLWNVFQKEVGKRYDFEDINMDFYSDFMFYYSKKDYTANTFGKMVKELKTIMGAAKLQKLHNNLDYLDPDFLITRYEATEVYLSRHEIDRLYNLDLEGKTTYDEVRDVFLIGCYTALRYSDYSRIKKIHVFDQLLQSGDSMKVLKIRTKKTSTPVEIPLSPDAVNILKKYDYNLPKTSEQKVNQYIKEICELAGLEDIIEVRTFVGNEERVESIPKYQLVKTHTARRTGATLMFLAKIPTLSIMMITGHKSETNFLKYIKATAEENAMLLSENSFFKHKTATNISLSKLVIS